MMQVTLIELERRCMEHGVSLRRLYPLWYRALRRVGIQIEPPIVLSLTQHYLYEGSLIGAVALVALVDVLFFSETSIKALIPFVFLIAGIPLWNWWRYRRLLRRLGY